MAYKYNNLKPASIEVKPVYPAPLKYPDSIDTYPVFQQEQETVSTDSNQSKEPNKSKNSFNNGISAGR